MQFLLRVQQQKNIRWLMKPFNTLADFPPDRFAITAHCLCGHSAQIDYRLLPPETLVSSLRPRLV